MKRIIGYRRALISTCEYVNVVLKDNDVQVKETPVTHYGFILMVKVLKKLYQGLLLECFVYYMRSE